MNNLNEQNFNCTGCGLCSNICPKSAIKIEYDKEGFFHYEIDKKKCISCGLCIKKCPQLNYKNNNIEENICVYSAYSKNDNIIKKSSSGGIFYELAKYVLENNGYVVGVTYDNKVKHIVIDNINDIGKLMGSKYLQSYTGNIYNLVKEKLRNKKPVLFTGTPCQCAAMRNFINDENLYIVDVICHGVPSINIFNKANKDRFNQNVTTVDFRSKDNGWKNYSIVYKNNEKVIKKFFKSEDEFFLGYIKNDYLMSSCYNCKFSTNIHTSDITIGDYWGIDQIDFEFCQKNNDKGISVVVINDDKGKKIFENIKKNLISKKQKYDNTLFLHNPRLNNGIYKIENLQSRKYFFEKDYNTSFLKRRYVISKKQKLIIKLKSPLIKLKAKLLNRK